MWPDCCVPSRLPAPRISRSLIAILKPDPSSVYCFMALILFLASPVDIKELGSMSNAYAFRPDLPTLPLN